MTDRTHMYDDNSPCLSAYGLPRYPNRTAAEANIPAGWKNRACIYWCGAGHHHIGYWPSTSQHPVPIKEAA